LFNQFNSTLDKITAGAKCYHRLLDALLLPGAKRIWIGSMDFDLPISGENQVLTYHLSKIVFFKSSFNPFPNIPYPQYGPWKWQDPTLYKLRRVYGMKYIYIIVVYTNYRIEVYKYIIHTHSQSFTFIYIHLPFISHHLNHLPSFYHDYIIYITFTVIYITFFTNNFPMRCYI
jgi:hypothetical protein